MTENEKLEALKNLGRVTTIDDARNFRDGVFGLFVESYDALHVHPVENHSELYNALVNNISAISINNVPADYMLDAISMVSTDHIRQNMISAQGDSLQPFYSNYTDFLIHIRCAIVAKTPKDESGIFKIKDDSLDMNPKDYALKNADGLTKAQTDAIDRKRKERGYSAYVV